MTSTTLAKASGNRSGIVFPAIRRRLELPTCGLVQLVDKEQRVQVRALAQVPSEH